VAETFAPFLSTTIPELIQLMAEADSLESKRKVDESLNKVIERSGTFVGFRHHIRIIQFLMCTGHSLYNGHNGTNSSSL
jgi:hypothetical protein